MTWPITTEDDSIAVEIRVRGLVQGVGFRPTVWRWAHELGLVGEVANDAAGLLLQVMGPTGAVRELCRRFETMPPRLARVDDIELAALPTGSLPAFGFRIAPSRSGVARTSMPPDAAICTACRAEILDPGERRHGYALTNCTDCGPRLSISTGVPYDRIRTTMAGFVMCAACAAEYADPADRRYHAEPIACRTCGPQVWLRATGGTRPCEEVGGTAAITAAARLLKDGACIAMKGLGGYQLACDATNAAAVARLRAAKQRSTKPFALMARDLVVTRRYAAALPDEEAQLRSAAAPIVLLTAALQARELLEGVAPGLDRLGFMLPATPLHVLLLQHFDIPLVMTSGNVSDEPQIIDDAEALVRLSGLADHVLGHDRPIAMRLDDSVIEVVDRGARMLRRARGYAPAGIHLPPGFERAPDVLAAGGDMKAAFCLLRDGEAHLSPHQGDLEDPATSDEFIENIDRFTRLLGVEPDLIACDRHPDYHSSRRARAEASARGLRLVEVQHHHAHIASCLAENGYPLDGPPVLGIALDGLGFGEDGTIWGGELLVADYRTFRRVGRLKPVAMPGGSAAAREPWRNLYAHLCAALGWEHVVARHGDLAAIRALAERPLVTLDRMVATGVNAPLASSCGRLFDAVAAACGLVFDRAGYEGEAAMRLEAAMSAACNIEPSPTPGGYPFHVAFDAGSGLIEIDPAPMWSALLDEAARDAPAAVMAVRFHEGLGAALIDASIAVARREAEGGSPPVETLVLSGGVFHNRKLLSYMTHAPNAGMRVLTHARVPAGDGGLALGQAAIASARAIDVRG